MNQRMRMRKGIIWLCMMLCVCLSGCNKEEEVAPAAQVVFTFGEHEVCLDEVWIYAETVIQGYEMKYGNQVWSIETKDEAGVIRTMEEITRQDIIENIRCTKTLVGQAETYKVELSEEELATAKTQAEEFYDNLTDDQLKVMGIQLETVERVFMENMLSDKVYQKMLAQGNLEVSDEEARMTTIYDMYFACYIEDSAGGINEMSDSDKERQKENAEAAYLALTDTDNPVDYDTIASRYSLKYGGSRTMSKAEMITEYGEKITEMLYKLENGTHTEVVKSEYGYHIIGMIALTDEEATQSRKNEIMEAKEKEFAKTNFANWMKELDKNWSYEKSVDHELYAKIQFGEGTE